MTADRVRNGLRWIMMGYAAFLPVSIALSQPLAFAMVPMVLWLYVKEPGSRPAQPMAWPALAFAAVALLSLAWSVRPGQTLAKMDRMLLLSVLFALPWLVNQARGATGPDLVGRLALCFVLGSSVQAALDLVTIPWSYHQALQQHEALRLAGELPARARAPSLFDQGNMRDPQMYMVALSLLLGWILYRRSTVGLRWWWMAAALNAVAFILHFKRGAWLAFLLSAAVLALVARRRRVVAFLVLAVLAALAIPQVRERLDLLRDEVRMKTGGRYALWTGVAPRMLEDYPWGMGWKAARHEDFMKYGVRIQPKLNHLHNNALQLRLELGWPGILAWAVWMGAGFVLMWKSYRASRGPPAAWAYGILGGFLALHLNGLVEYNFGDAEIFMLFTLLLGLAAAQRNQMQATGTVPG